jgi:PAS domain S-box-containing protein
MPENHHSELNGEALLEAILDSATGYAIITLDRDRAITSWNTGAELIFGWPAKEMIGQSADAIFTPEDREIDRPGIEMRKALDDGIARDERWHMRQDGSRFWASGLLMPLKNGGGFLKIARDEADRRRGIEALRESREHFLALVENVPQLIWRCGSLGECSWVSPQWAAFTGLSEEESLGQGWSEAVHPDDRTETAEAFPKAQATGELYLEHRIRRGSDGHYIWFQSRATRLSADPEEWLGTSTDIDELKRLKERQDLLMRELHHRTGNLLAVVGSIARRTAQSSESIDDFQSRFGDRLLALSRVQSLIAREASPELDIGDLVELELTAQGWDIDGAKIVTQGPRFLLNARQAEALALALHELATNTMKYGALAQEDGKLLIEWSPCAGAGLIFEWQESGVPSVAAGAETRRGYGRELIEVALPHALGATTMMEFRPGEGVYCRIELAAHPKTGPS